MKESLVTLKHVELEESLNKARHSMLPEAGHISYNAPHSWAHEAAYLRGCLQDASMF